MITLGELRSRIATAMASEIGTKTFATATADVDVMALVVDEGKYKMASGALWPQKPKKHNGLEVVIQPEIDSFIQPLLSDDYYLRHTTRITLKQWDVTDNVKTGRSLLIQELGNLIDRIGPRIARNGPMDTVEQQSFDIVQFSTS